ncbi:KptA family-domain-containing protein [Thelephora terrestris]|uniref:2'-phosphotransferase n=1 Tax=Thelephora terrestris TaxID=56493 RepID=A0A9P6HEU1_9AGAM|nr:KptA family-domain-containing protein [Thelephora terrestris]
MLGTLVKQTPRVIRTHSTRHHTRRAIMSEYSTQTKRKDRKPQQQPSAKLKGNPRDDPKTRLSKTLSFVLRHGAEKEGIPMRPDGFVLVNDLLAKPKFRELNLETLQSIVKEDNKQRYHLVQDVDQDGVPSHWIIRANQGHSLKTVEVDSREILSADEVPMAVHGTNRKAWASIEKQGLSRMTRNHIHIAQGLAGDTVISGTPLILSHYNASLTPMQACGTLPISSFT